MRGRSGRSGLAAGLGALALAAGATGLFFSAAPASRAHEAISTRLTWTRDVSRIFHQRCAGCHREGGSAPMPLTTFSEVRPWAAAVKHEVLTRRMPPWGAVKGFGTFSNDRSLSLPEIAMISSWVQGGAPEGEQRFLEPFHYHPDDGQTAPRTDGRLPWRGTAALDRQVYLTGVSTSTDYPQGWMQLAAHLPGGRVEHLLWLRGPRPGQPQDYWLLHPVRLDAGTIVVCQPEAAAVVLRWRETDVAAAR